MGEGGVIQGCNFSWTIFWRFELDPALWEQHNASMMALLETVYSGEVACLGAAFWGGGGGSARAGCAGPRPGRDMGTRVRVNKELRGDESFFVSNQPWVGRSITKVGGGRLELPNLQVLCGRKSKPHTTVHVERLFGSVGGLLNTTTLHPSFEALVHGVDPKVHKPEF